MMVLPLWSHICRIHRTTFPDEQIKKEKKLVKSSSGICYVCTLYVVNKDRDYSFAGEDYPTVSSP